MQEGRFQPTVIHNRDIPLLAEVLCIMQDLRMTEQQREWQHDRLTNITLAKLDPISIYFDLKLKLAGAI